MEDGIYCFGGSKSPFTCDFLPNGQNEWQVGPKVPDPGIDGGHGVAISQTELLLIGGFHTANRILKHNINKKAWTEVGRLIQRRWSHRCFFHHGKVIITGGYDKGYLKSSEIFNILDGTERRSCDLNVARGFHGMGIVHIKGKSKLIVFGGQNESSYLDSIEEWDDDSEKWKMSTMKLSAPKFAFGYCQLPHPDFKLT